MSDTVISVENISKLYRLGQVGTGTLSHDLNRWWHRIRGKDDPYVKVGRVNDRTQKSESDYVWSLQDVSFEVKQGEVLGIIGRNGAGKSTLLKILSRVTAPTSGRIRVKGRVASLLEVGTGFHPELTGRENIYLNGAILGMRKAEINQKLDEIVEFSGCAAYLDTPVKRYSSGMTVRLAFAVAAYLDAEVLVIDEVLAVGDADFQKKCLDKIENVSRSGRTILFVSHNMGTISSLCSRAILLDNGRVIADGPPSETIMAYYTKGKATPFMVDFTQGAPIAGEGATLLSGMVANSDGTPAPEVSITQSCEIRMRYRIDRRPISALFPNFFFNDSSGACAFVSSAQSGGIPTDPGIYEAVCHLPANFLNDGTYFVSLALTQIDGRVKIAFFEKDALCLHARDPMEETLHTSRNGWAGPIPGTLRPQLSWSVTYLS
jgi:lipopolysaccharide transport system ATP-binding protein